MAAEVGRLPGTISIGVKAAVSKISALATVSVFELIVEAPPMNSVAAGLQFLTMVSAAVPSTGVVIVVGQTAAAANAPEEQAARQAPAIRWVRNFMKNPLG